VKGLPGQEASGLTCRGKRTWPRERLYRLRDFLALQRNVAVLLAALIVIGSGEELWARLIPNYLEALGGTALTVSA